MKVKELKELIDKLDQEATVLLYIDEAEEFGALERIKLFTPENADELPYAKGDQPEITGPTALLVGELV